MWNYHITSQVLGLVAYRKAVPFAGGQRAVGFKVRLILYRAIGQPAR